jgi:hypothetical protein
MAAVDINVQNEGDRGDSSGYGQIPFQADGGYSVPGALMLIGLLGFAGLLLGIVASIVSTWFYLIIVFPLLIGLGVGAVGAHGVRRFQIRTPVLCGLAGFCGGCLAMLAMHYTDFRREIAYRADHSTAREVEIASRIDEIKQDPATSPEDRSLAKEMEADPLYLKLLQVQTFGEYVDFNASRGVELRRTGRGQGVNLGYAGSYLYWVFEVLIVAGVALTIMKSAAKQPFCAICDTWKTEQEYPGVGGSPGEIAAALARGDFVAVQQQLAAEGESSVVNLWVCPNCEEDAPFEVEIKEIKTNTKGEAARKSLCLMTYPGEALIEVRGIVFPYAAAAAFGASDDSAIADAVPATSTEVAAEQESA